MRTVSETVVIEASLTEVWEFYFRPDTWAAWVDGFGGVASADGYPEGGGTLRWRSVPAGRGEVSERVLAHEPRRLHRIAFADPMSEGELETRFEIEAGEPAPADSGAEPRAARPRRPRSRVTQELSYRLRRAGPLGPLTDLLFIRGQVRRSLGRSLGRLRLELEERAGDGASPRQEL